MDTEALAQRVRELREARGWSQQDVQAHGGPAQEIVSKVERGKMKRPSHETLNALAHAFGIGLGELLQTPGGASSAVDGLAAQARFKMALARAFDPDAHDFDDAAALRQMVSGEAFDNFTDAELAEACGELLTVATNARRLGERLSPSILIAGLIRRLLPVPYALAQAQAPAPALRMVAESGPKAVLPSAPGAAEGAQVAEPRPKTTKAPARKRRPG